MLKLLRAPFKLAGWVVSLLFAAVEPAPPDEDAESPRLRNSIGGYYALEDPAEFIEKTRSWFKGEGYGVAPKDIIGGGGGMLSTRGRIVIDAGGGGGGGEAQNDAGEVSMGYGNGYGDVGIVLVQTRFFRIYPLVGIGAAGGGMGGRKPGEEETHSASWGALVTNVGIGIDFTVRLWRVGVTVGLRFGRYTSLASMQTGEGDFIEPPDGPFFRVLIGPRILFG